jgi:hypothetical protein
VLLALSAQSLPLSLQLLETNHDLPLELGRSLLENDAMSVGHAARDLTKTQPDLAQHAQADPAQSLNSYKPSAAHRPAPL